MQPVVVLLSFFLCSQSHSHDGVGGVEVIYNIRYSLGEQEKSWQTEQPSSQTVLYVSVHFNQEKMALWASCCTSQRRECSQCVNPSLQSMLCLFCKIKPNGLEKGNLLFCSFLSFFWGKKKLQRFLVLLLSKGLSLFIMPQPLRRDKMPPVPSRAHSFSVPVCLCPCTSDTMPPLLFYCWHSAMNVWALCKWRGLNSWQAMSSAPWHTGPHMLCGIMMTLGSSDNIRTHFR